MCPEKCVTIARQEKTSPCSCFYLPLNFFCCHGTMGVVDHHKCALFRLLSACGLYPHNVLLIKMQTQGKMIAVVTQFEMKDSWDELASDKFFSVASEKWHFKLMNIKHNERFLLYSKQYHMNRNDWTIKLFKHLSRSAATALNGTLYGNILWLGASCFLSLKEVTQWHTFLCNLHRGAYIIYLMVRPWGFCGIAREAWCHLFTCKSLCISVSTQTPQIPFFNSKLSSMQEPITERTRWHVGVAQDGWPQFSASVSTPDGAVNGPHSQLSWAQSAKHSSKPGNSKIC